MMVLTAVVYLFVIYLLVSQPYVKVTFSFNRNTNGEKIAFRQLNQKQSKETKHQTVLNLTEEDVEAMLTGTIWFPIATATDYR